MAEREQRPPIPKQDDAMRARVAEGERRAEAFVKATQGKGKPFSKMTHGDGKPPTGGGKRG